MNSKKDEAIRLRKLGYSLTSINKTLNIPKSTLSGWLKSIELNDKQKAKLNKRWQEGLIEARAKAKLWHHAEKAKRLSTAKEEALGVLKNINFSNIENLELNLAILYLAEGSKKNTETALGSSDPSILQFFLFCMERIYHYNRNRARYELYIRSDQQGSELKKYWSEILNVKIEQFKQVSIDRRSTGTTYSNYKGVCSIRCGTVAIQRRLVYLAKEYFAAIAKSKTD